MRCSFTVQQGDKEWQQWAEIPSEMAADRLWHVIRHLLGLTEPIAFFTTTTTTDGHTECSNQVTKVPARDAIGMLAKIAEEWEQQAEEEYNG